MKCSKREHRKIVVLQLSRIGDIIMSLPVLEALSKQYKGAEICFFINGMFEELLPDSPFFRIVPVHFNALFEKLIEADTVENSLDVLDDYLGEYFNDHFDLVVNLSSQKLSAIITSLLNADDKLGLAFSEDESLINPHPGLSLFTKIKTGRKINWVHQVEIFLSAVDGFKPTPIHETAKYLFEDRLHEFAGKRLMDKKYILISPGASIPEKEIGKGTLESILQSILAHTDHHIVISGKDEEAMEHKELSLIGPDRIIDYAGKTRTLKALFNLIQYSECLISNDSGPMHIAALLDKKNILFSTGPAFFPETTGYNRNIMVLTSQRACYPCPWIDFACQQDYLCKEEFDVDQVTERIVDYINENNAESEDTDWNGYKTAITENGLFFIPQGKVKLSANEFMGIVYQSFWKEKLFDIDAAMTLTYLLGHYETGPSGLYHDLENIKAYLQNFRVLLDEILQWFSEFKRHGNPQVLDKLNKGIDTIFKSSDQETFLAPLLQYYKVLYHSTIMDNPNKTLMEYHIKSIALKGDLDKIGDLVLHS